MTVDRSMPALPKEGQAFLSWNLKRRLPDNLIFPKKHI